MSNPNGSTGPRFQRLMLLFVAVGLVAAVANFACLQEVCADMKTASFVSMDDMRSVQIETLADAIKRSRIELTDGQRAVLASSGELFGVVKLERPVKHPGGRVEMPAGWLPEMPMTHPWTAKLTPADDAFYSFFEERVLQPRLFDPANPQHMEWAAAYLSKARSSSPEFIGWTYANRTECAKIKYDAADQQSAPDVL